MISRQIRCRGRWTRSYACDEVSAPLFLHDKTEKWRTFNLNGPATPAGAIWEITLKKFLRLHAAPFPLHIRHFNVPEITSWRRALCGHCWRVARVTHSSTSSSRLNLCSSSASVFSSGYCVILSTLLIVVRETSSLACSRLLTYLTRIVVVFQSFAVWLERFQRGSRACSSPLSGSMKRRCSRRLSRLLTRY